MATTGKASAVVFTVWLNVDNSATRPNSGGDSNGVQQKARLKIGADGLTVSRPDRSVLHSARWAAVQGWTIEPDAFIFQYYDSATAAAAVDVRCVSQQPKRILAAVTQRVAALAERRQSKKPQSRQQEATATAAAQLIAAAQNALVERQKSVRKPSDQAEVPY